MLKKLEDLSNYKEIESIFTKYGYNEVTIENLKFVEKDIRRHLCKCRENEIDKISKDNKIIINAINIVIGCNEKENIEYLEAIKYNKIKFEKGKLDYITSIVEDNYKYVLKKLPQVSAMDLLINANIKLDVPDEEETKTNAWIAANTNHRSGYGANKIGTSRDSLRHRNLRQNFLIKCKQNNIQTVRAMDDDGKIYDLNINELNSDKEWDHILNLAWLTGEPDENNEYNNINPILYKIFRMHNNDIEASVAYINRPENLIFISKQMNQSTNTDEYGAKHVKYQISSESKILSDGAKKTYQKLENDLIDEIELENMYMTLKASMKCALDTIEGVLISSLITSICDNLLVTTKHILIQKINGNNSISDIAQWIIEKSLEDKNNKSFIKTLKLLVKSFSIKKLLKGLAKGIATTTLNTLKGLLLLPKVMIDEIGMIWKALKPVKSTNDLKESASSKVVLLSEGIKLSIRLALNEVEFISYNTFRVLNAIFNTAIKMAVMIVRTIIDMKDRFNDNIDKYRECLLNN